MATHFLSKSTFIRGLQCTKSLYLNKFYAELKDPLPEERRLRFAAGHETGFRARDLFPGGVDASPLQFGRVRESVDLTASLIQQNTPVIYEPAFIYNDVLIYLDILVLGQSGWIANEVKSSALISKTYKDDAALQYYVINGSGLPLADFNMIHLVQPLSETNLRDDPHQLFQTTSLLAYCINQSKFVEDTIMEFRNVIAYPKIPVIEMGPQCHQPYTCDFIGFCTKQKSNIMEGLFNQTD
jgi:hypothetical protein